MNSEKSNHMMRKAALVAGLGTNTINDNLILCLEPEGVCFSALSQSMLCFNELNGGGGGGGGGGRNNMNNNDNNNDNDEFCDVDYEIKESSKLKDSEIGEMLLIKGNKFIIFDAGGGTIDIASYEVISEIGTKLFQVKQLALPTGGPYGSTQVDDLFMNMIHDIIGIEATFLIHNKYRVIGLELRRNWEAIKINAKQVISNERGRIIPASTISLASLQSEVLLPLGLNLSTLIHEYVERKKLLFSDIISEQCYPELKGIYSYFLLMYITLFRL